VVLPGYVDDEALQWLNQNCFALVYPSLWEGFGLPVLEAMSQGAAVITSAATSLPEVAGDAAVLVDPLDEAALADAMHRLQTSDSLRRSLKQRAVLQAARFSWTDTARVVLDAYQYAWENPRGSPCEGGCHESVPATRQRHGHDVQPREIHPRSRRQRPGANAE
jgi:glycosyltransferase involved in cell wall biosynthesis